MIFFYHHVKEEANENWKQNVLEVFLVLVQALVDVLFQELERLHIVAWLVSVKNSLKVGDVLLAKDGGIRLEKGS